MFLVPYRRQVLSSRLAPEAIALRISQRIHDGTFRGETSSERFTLGRRTLWERSAYKPYIRGRIRRSETGSAVEVTYTLHIFDLLFMVVLSLVALGHVIESNKWTLLCMVVALHCGWYIASFIPSSWNAENKLQDCLT